METVMLQILLLTTALTHLADCYVEQQVYILLIGASGSGKSSTMNRFLKTDLAPTSESESATSEINEYSVGISSNSNAELIIIDTPGLGDTRGLERDAQFLATLQEYLKNHKHLGSRPPDVVLICSRFDENRFYGENSKYVKMLKSMGVLRNQFVNMKSSNLIFLMTHFMGLEEKYTNNPENITSKFRETIQEFSLFPNPINFVFAENAADEWELEETPSGFKLPNGDIYPQNLCTSIEKTILHQKENTDKINLLQSICTQNAENLNISVISKIDLISVNNPGTKKFLTMLSATNLNTQDTEISKLLSQTFANFSDSVKKVFPAHALPLLQKSLHLRLITELKDIPVGNEDVASLFRDLGNENYISHILKKAFNLEQPNPPFSMLIGKCYSLLQDTVLESKLSHDELGKQKPSKLGYMMQEKVIVSTIESNDVKELGEIFYSEEEYFKYRATTLGVQTPIPGKIFFDKIKPGMNIITNGIGCNSLLLEFRLFKLETGTFCKISETFLNLLRNLPTFNVSDISSIQIWNSFLKVYGTHVVVSSFGGGSIEITSNDENSQCSVFPNWVRSVKNDIVTTDGINISNLTKSGKIVKISGGDSKFHSNDLGSFFKMNYDGRQSLFKLWRESLKKKPTILNNSLKIKPITEFIKSVSNELFVKLTTPIDFIMSKQNKEHPLLVLVISLENVVKKLTEENVSIKQTNDECKFKTTQHTLQILNVTQKLIAEKQLVNEGKVQLESRNGQNQLLTSQISNLKEENKNLKSRLTSEQNKHHAAALLSIQQTSQLSIYKSKVCQAVRYLPKKYSSNSIVAGTDHDGVSLAICKAYHADNELPGKMVHGVCNVPYGSKEHEYQDDKFEVLDNGASANLTWLRSNSPPINAVGCGSNCPIRCLNVVKMGKNTIQPGKYDKKLNTAYYSWGGVEHVCSGYEFLVCSH